MKNTIKKSFICAFAALATLAASAFDTPYLTFRSADTFSLQVGTGTTGGWNGTMEYSTDTVNWATWDGTEITAGDSGSDYRLYLRGTGNSTVTSGSQWKYWMFPTGSDIYCEGDIETLRQYDGTTPPAMNASCYYGLFKGCTKLKSAPALSAMTLAANCYKEMFNGCTALESAGPIGATSTAQDCCYQMFYDCKALTNAPSLHATTLTTRCYSGMFNGCNALTTAPEMDATTVADSCCASMFKKCTSLTNAPVLHAETLTSFCYQNMFEGCTKLVAVPDLTATTLASQCYKEMFKGCSSLEVAPAITATTLAASCCENMFWNCTKLTTVPDFPAVPLANNCYYAMFQNCTSLVEPPALPATELANNCYQLMFLNCTSLISLPKLNATTVPNYAYNAMFQGCSKLEISTTLTPGKKTWKLPAGLVGGSNWNASMFYQTKNWANGTTGPQAGITYYILSKDSTELSQSANEFNAWTGDTISVNLASTIVGGSMTYVFSGLTGAPAGVTLDGATLSATIATAGTYDFTVHVEDTSSTPLTLDAEYRIIVTDPDPITAPGANLGKARVGKEKSYTLADTVAGGVAPYTFTLKSGSIPGGYTLVNGVLSGTATEDKTNTFILTITDKLNVSQDIEYTLVTYTPVGIKDDDPDEPETGDTIEYFNGDDTFQRTCTRINNASTVVTWEDSWYYVTGNVALSKGAIVNGKVSLILCDGATLTINGESGTGRAGIHVVVDGVTTNTLTIYGQAEGTGKLRSTGAMYAAGIGGDNKGDVNTGTGLCNCGKVNIYGGVIEAHNNSESAAIGGGRYGSGGTITIYGGDVSAICNSYASGIGGASSSGNGAGGNVTVYGGRVSANSGTPAYAGIGSYSNRSQGTLTVGPNVKVKADNSNPPTTVLPRGAGGVIDLGTGANRMYFLLEESGPDPLDRTGSGTLQVYDNEAVNWNIAETIVGGTDPYTLSASNLPDGLSMSDGVISGSVATVGEYPITVEVTDRTSPAMETNFVYTLTVTYAPKAITYKDGDATLVGLEPAQYSPGTATAIAPSAEKTGYTFGGWYDNAGLQGDAVTAVSAEATTPQTFWAKWTPVEYTVTYMDGGTPITDQGLTPTSFTIESATLALPATATKAGKGFYGWYDNSDCLGSAVTTIPAGTHENKTFWAKWGAAVSMETYVDASGSEQPQVECLQIASDTTGLTAGWYVAKGTVAISTGLTVSGDVKIILADGATLTVTQSTDNRAGINVATGDSLTIYGQSLGTGSLSATGQSMGAGIGGNEYQSCGTVTINGGTVNATGGGSGAGIGGGYGGAGGAVTINGGTVAATSGAYGGAGIGGGSEGAGGTVTINGGSVVAHGRYTGVGGASSNGTLTVGDDIAVKAGSSESNARSSAALEHGEEGAINITTDRAWYVIEVRVPDPLGRTGDVALQVYASQAVEWDVGSGITGGTPPYALAAASLPNGLQLANGVLSGSVAAAGEYPITVMVTDNTSPAMVTNFVYTLTVVAPDPIVSSTTDLGTAKVGVAKSFAISELISGGAEALTFALVGEAPAGFTFTAATGVLSGTATATGPLSVTISATDIVGNSQTFAYSFEAVQTGAVDEGEPAESDGGAYTTYVAVDGNERGRMCNQIASSDTAVTWESGWYYVTGDVTLSAGAVVNGYVCLILGDGATLTVTQSDNDKAGINVGSGKTLAVYGQTVSSGSVSATGGYYGAGIGGNKSQAGGTFKVYGGRVDATGGYYGSGIGGGYYAAGGTVNVYGGAIEATAGSANYAIGVGRGGGSNSYSSGNFYVFDEEAVVKAGSSSTVSLTKLTPDATTHKVTVYTYKYFIVTGPLPMAQKTSSLGTALTGQQKSWTLATSTYSSYIQDGKMPYTFDPENSTLPEGFSLTADGVLSGRPSAAGNYEFTVAVSDATPSTSNFVFTLTVNDPVPITVAKTDYGSIAKGTSFYQTISPSGGVSPYTFNSAGGRPDGINFYTEAGVGVLSGSCSIPGDYKFTITITDSALPANVQPIEFSLSVKDVYAITYHVDEETPSLSPATYVEDTGVATLPTPSKAGYAFLGWYDNPDYYGAPVTSIPADAKGAKDLYAKWYVPEAGNISVTFTGANGEQTETCTVIEPSMAAYDSAIVKSGSKLLKLTSGWYVVANIDTLDNKTSILIDGEVNIVLRDDRSLTVVKGADASSGTFSGVILTVGNTLNIYGQTKGTGRLAATGNGASSGIGSCSAYGYRDCGTLKVYGGTVVATGGNGGAGIGGWSGSSKYGGAGDGGTVEIYGGTVTATGTSGGAGIGGGGNPSCGRAGCGGIVKIYGGTVTAIGSAFSYSNGTEEGVSAGIGGGGGTDDGDRVNIPDLGGDGGTVEIYNGNVTAIGGAINELCGTGIGAGNTGDSHGTLKVSGEYAIVYAGDDADSATERTPGANDMVELDGSLYYEIQGEGAAPVTYNITYMSAGVPQTWLEPNNYTHGFAQTLATPDPREGYTFDGWFVDDQFNGDAVTEVPANATGDKTFYAKWAPVSYAITYKNADGSVIDGLAPTTYTIESGATLPTSISLVKEGWVFDGWCSYPTGPQVTTIPAGTTGNKTFYVRWDVADFGLFDGELFPPDAGVEAEWDLAETIHKGTAPYTFALKDTPGNALPDGLTLNSDGTLSGSVAVAGEYVFTITVTDSSEPQKTIDAEYTMFVCFHKSALGKLGEDAELLIGHPMDTMYLPEYLSGGTGPYTFEWTSGSLPSGLRLNGRRLEGTPTEKGNFYFRLEVTDARGVSSPVDYWIYVRSSTAQEHFEINGLDWHWVSSAPPKEPYRMAIYNDGARVIPGTTEGCVYVPTRIGNLKDPITCLGVGAFSNCTAITRVTLPDTIIDIGGNAFFNCTSLTSVVVRDNVENINTNAFKGCSSLAVVYVDQGDANRVRDLFAASGCDVSGIAFVECVFYNLSLDVNLGTELWMPVLTKPYVESSYLPTVGNLPVPTRNHYTFDGWYTEKFGGIRINEDDKLSGGDWTLYAHWTTTLPEPVFSIDNDYNGERVLQYITLNRNAEVTIPDGVEAIGGSAKTAHGGYVFTNSYDRSIIQRVTMPSSVKRIRLMAFSDCDNLTEVYLSSSLTNIGRSAFSYCGNLKSIDIPGTVDLIDGAAFFLCTNLAELVIGDGVREIGESAFYGCSSLQGNGNEGLVIPDSVKIIGESAFMSTGIRSLTLPKGVVIGNRAFAWCEKLETVNIGGEILRSSPKKLLSRGRLLAAAPSDPDAITVGKNAFSGNGALESITIGSSVDEIGGGAFSGCRNLTTVTLQNNDNFTVAAGMLLTKDGSTLVSVYGSNASLTVPDGVTTIQDGAFVDDKTLTSVVLPSGVTTIGAAAFSNATEFATITIPYSVTAIGANAFCDTKLATVYVAEGDTARVRGLIAASGYNTAGITFLETLPPAPSEEPSIEGDPSATVTGNATDGFVVTPSTTSGTVEVVIPSGIDAEKVTVEVPPTATVKPNGANVAVVKTVDATTYDITEFLDLPAAVEGVIDLNNATVKAAIVKEALDPTKEGVNIDLKPASPSITTAATRPGLTYTFSEGTTLEGMVQKAVKVGDGTSWTPTITVKGGTSGFYSIGVTK